VRYAWIECHRDDYAVTRMCRLLAVSRTGYLQWRRRPPSARAQANARLDAQVAAMHAASKGSYGRPRIVRGLREQGLRVGPERVRRSQAPLPGDDGFQSPPAGGAERPRASV
jgi:putative transposase